MLDFSVTDSLSPQMSLAAAYCPLTIDNTGTLGCGFLLGSDPSPSCLDSFGCIVCSCC